MDQIIAPLLQSGNVWLVVLGAGIMLTAQWAKKKFSPTPTPDNPTPGPTPTPAPNGGTPILDALLEILKKRLLGGVAPFVSFGEGPVRPSGPPSDPQHEAAAKLMKIISALDS